MSVALSEVVGALSLASDLGMGQPLEHGLRTCLLGLAIGDRLDLDRQARADVYYLSLLRWIGCTAHAYELSQLFGDEIATHERAATIDFGRPLDVLIDLLRHAGANRPPLERARVVAGALAAGQSGVHGLFEASCEVAVRLADRLDVGSGVGRALNFVFARWDGRGYPPVTGEDIPLAARVMHVAQDAAVFHRLSGTEAAVEVVRRRSAAAYDPGIAATFLARPAELLAATERDSLWDAVIGADPLPPRPLDGTELDEALGVIADFADLKSPFTAGHSRRVADMAAGAARECGLPPNDVTDIRRAGLVHDIGRVGVPNSVWDKPGPLTDGEREQVRLHPYLTERILARSAGLRPLRQVACMHHERLDGSGYHRGGDAAALTPAARLLAAADVYEAVTADRPHRGAMETEAAATLLRHEVRSGRLDGDAVRGVLTTAGHRLGRRRTEWPAALTTREVDVLRLLAGGLSTKAIAAELAISPKSADHHIQHIYDKIGVRTRAGAALFAVQHGLARA